MVAFWLGQQWPEIVSGGFAVVEHEPASGKRDVYHS